MMKPLRFLEYFWDLNVREKDLDNFRDFTSFTNLEDYKVRTYKLAKKLRRPYTTIASWRKEKRKPKIAHFFNLYQIHGKPKENHVWLWVNLLNDFTPVGDPIQVPLNISSWNDIKNVIRQLKPLDRTILPNKLTKEECFAFVLGMDVGDVGKLSKKRDRLDLQLTKNITTNKILGEFFCDCLKRLGFEAHRIKDNKNKFRWHSQSSPFFKWIYNVVLGLNDNETTTYNSIKMKWILHAPKHIVKRFLQGIFESDGSVLYDAKITCSSFPNTELIQMLLQRFGIKSHIVNDRGWKRLGIEGFKQLKKTHKLLFAEEIKTKRYQRLEKIVNAEKINGRKMPEWIEGKISKLKSEGFKNYQILKLLLENYNFIISRRTLQRVLLKMN